MADEKEYDDEESVGNVFWTLKIPVGEETDIPQPSVPGYIIRITSATFGEKVNPKSRTVVNCIQTFEDGKESTSPLCVLREGNSETVSLDILISEAVTFKLSGKKPSEVTLNGFLTPPQMDNQMPMGIGMDEAAMEDIEEARIEEELRKRRKRKLDDNEKDIQKSDDIENGNNQESDNDNDDNDDDDKEKVDDNDNDDDNDKNDEEEEEEEEAKPEPVAKKRKLNNDTPKGKKNKKKNDDKKNKKNNKKELKTLKGGIKFKDMKIGDGKAIKVGDTLNVRYVGQLEDKTVFDKAISGNGFDFTFGKGEVIKGWDIGLKGMKVGGKRRLVIPPKFAYGKQGSEPSIPPNSTLTFTIEIRKAK